MSMTKEEAIKQIEKLKSYCEYMGDSDESGAYLFDLDVQALNFALSVLRPITREQVEKAWGSGGWETVPDKGFVDTAGRQVYHLHCPHCGFFWRETGHAKYFRFCPACGAPMTDETVDMVMERLEALYDKDM